MRILFSAKITRFACKAPMFMVFCSLSHLDLCKRMILYVSQTSELLPHDSIGNYADTRNNRNDWLVGFAISEIQTGRLCKGLQLCTLTPFREITSCNINIPNTGFPLDEKSFHGLVYISQLPPELHTIYTHLMHNYLMCERHLGDVFTHKATIENMLLSLRTPPFLVDYHCHHLRCVCVLACWVTAKQIVYSICRLQKPTAASFRRSR